MITPLLEDMLAAGSLSPTMFKLLRDFCLLHQLNPYDALLQAHIYELEPLRTLLCTMYQLIPFAPADAAADLFRGNHPARLAPHQLWPIVDPSTLAPHERQRYRDQLRVVTAAEWHNLAPVASAAIQPVKADP